MRPGPIRLLKCFYPKHPWDEMGNESKGDGGFHRGGLSPLSHQYHPRRLEKYLKIEAERPVPPAIARHERTGVDVLKIQIHPIFKTHIVPTLYVQPRPIIVT